MRCSSIFVLMLTDVCIYRPFVIAYEVEYAKWLGIPIITVSLRGNPAWNREIISREALLPRIADEAKKINFKQKEARKAKSPSLQNNVIYDIPMPQVPGFTFTVLGDKLTLVEYVGAASAVTVPGKILMPGGKPYKVVIGKGAFVASSQMLTDDFEWRDPLTSVVIEEGVTAIEESAFQDCLNLTEVTIPNSVTYIGEQAFSGCRYLKNVTIPTSVTYIGRKAFSQCSTLAQITIPASVKKLGMAAFERCYKLKSVILEAGITSIPENLFCHGAFEAIDIPETVTEIGADAFMGCAHLRRVRLPRRLSAIGNHAFMDCSRLAQITIPDGVTHIENDTFRNCSSLTSVTLPEGIRRINARAFAHCAQLAEIAIPQGVIHIGEYAFQNAAALRADLLETASEALYTAPNAFEGTAVLIQSDLDFAWDTIVDKESDWEAGSQALIELLQGDDAPAEPETSGGILPKCEDNPRALVIVTEEDMTRPLTEKQTIADFITELYWEGYNVHYNGLSEDAGDGCAYTLAFLTQASVASEAVLALLSKAIKAAPSRVILVMLENGAWLPDELNAAMRGHQAILKMNNTDAGLTAEIRRILKDEAFQCHEERPRGFALSEDHTDKGKNAVLTRFNPTGFKRVIIPQSFTDAPMRLRKIGQWAFDTHCDTLESMVIPEGVTEIERYAFVGCQALKSITIPRSVEKIGDNAIGGWVTLRAYAGSAAAQYAEAYGIPLDVI